MRAEHRGRARRAQGLRRDKARRLSLPLSEKGHEVARQGTFTGVGVGTLRGRFVTLDNSDKLASTVAAGRDPLVHPAAHVALSREVPALRLRDTFRCGRGSVALAGHAWPGRRARPAPPGEQTGKVKKWENPNQSKRNQAILLKFLQRRMLRQFL